MEDAFSLTHVFKEVVLCAAIHVAFGVFAVEPVLEGMAEGLKAAMA